MNLINLLLVLSATTIALPTTTTSSSHPFILKSRSLLPNTTFSDDLLLTPYHIGPAYNYAVLAPASSSNPGIIGHLNGTAAELAAEEADLIFDFGFGDGDLFYGFVIDQVNATYSPVFINAGNGTRGIFVDQGVIKYHNPLSGGFYGM